MPHVDPEARRTYQRDWARRQSDRIRQTRRCRCGAPIPPGRRWVCSDACWRSRPRGTAVRCHRCGGERSSSKRGNTRYCDRCRADARREAMERNSLRRRRQLVGSKHSEADWRRLLARFHGRCAYCGARATARDHVIPVSRGGSDAIGNILPACTTCNVSKYDLLLVEWRHGYARNRSRDGRFKARVRGRRLD